MRVRSALRSVALGILSAVVVSPVDAANETAFDDEFLVLDERTWSTCQIDMEDAPPVFTDDVDDPGDRAIEIPVHSRMVSDNCCNDAACLVPEATAIAGLSAETDLEFTARLAEDGNEGATEGGFDDIYPDQLGPNVLQLLFEDARDGSTELEPEVSAFFGEHAVAPPPSGSPQPDNPYCTPDVRDRADPDVRPDRVCVQRQELRPDSGFRHAYDDAHRYSFRFRIPGPVNDPHFIRWVIAQWKHEPAAERYDLEWGENGGPSPYLAQRYNGGLFYVTVQDEHCRCIVATSGNPLATAIWRDGTPTACFGTEGPGERLPCEPNLTVTYGDDPELSLPRSDWVEMHYLVRAGRQGDGLIEIHEGDRFIARIEGNIGYHVDPGDSSVVKFKFGHYRDYQPDPHIMEVDWIEVTPVAP